MEKASKIKGKPNSKRLVLSIFILFAGIGIGWLLKDFVFQEKIKPKLTLGQISSDIKALIPQTFQHVDDNYLAPVFAYEPKILKIIGPIGNFTIALIKPPFREFPNFLVYNFDDETKEWNRVHEGLSLGIILPEKNHIDLHRSGDAVDFEAQGKNVEKTIKHFQSNGMSVSNYGTFGHAHSGGRELYHLDKNGYVEWAKIIVGVPFSGPIKDKKMENTCEYYGTPEMEDFSFERKGGEYLIEARTENKQRWQIKFSGTDGKRLLNKNLRILRE